jgi:hypothetical protein
MAAIHRLSFLLTALLWLAMCAASELVTEELVRAAQQPTRMPGNDEWYRPAPGFEKEPPGTILKYRKVPKGLTINNKDPLKIKEAWQILYRTQNSVGEADATVVTVGVPNGANKKNLLMYHWFSVSPYH